MCCCEDRVFGRDLLFQEQRGQVLFLIIRNHFAQALGRKLAQKLAALLIAVHAAKADLGQRMLQDDLGEMKDYVDLSGLTLEVNLGFTKNGKGTVTMSKEAAKEFAQKAFNLVCEGAVDYLGNKFEVSDEKWTEYLEELGMTEQELLDTVLEKIETENAAEDIAEKLEYNAFYYCLKDGKIYISETKEFDEEDAAGYKMTEDALYIEVDGIAVKFDRAE